jgi:hypothetical protein
MPVAWAQPSDEPGLCPPHAGFLAFVDNDRAPTWSKKNSSSQDELRKTAWNLRFEPHAIRSVGSVNVELQKAWNRVKASLGNKFDAWLSKLDERPSANPAFDSILGLEPNEILDPDQLLCIAYGVTTRFMYIGISGGADTINESRFSIHMDDDAYMMNYVPGAQHNDIIFLDLIKAEYDQPYQFVPVRGTNKTSDTPFGIARSFVTVTCNKKAAPVRSWVVGSVDRGKNSVYPERIDDYATDSDPAGFLHNKLEVGANPCVKISLMRAHRGAGLSHREIVG